MNPIDQAMSDPELELGDWNLLSVERTVWPTVSAGIAESVGGLRVIYVHDSLNVQVAGEGSTLGNAVADAARKVAALREPYGG